MHACLSLPFLWTKLAPAYHCLSHPLLRIAELGNSLGISLTKKSVQLDAWVAKKFMVLLKRKLQRGQVPRTGGFRHLMAAVFPEMYGDQACPSHLRFERFYFHAKSFQRVLFPSQLKKIQ